MPELTAANQSVTENATKHAANLTAEARQRQRWVYFAEQKRIKRLAIYGDALKK